jgi:hypothetical protein
MLRLGDGQQAETYYRDALAIAERLHGPDSAEANAVREKLAGD